VRREFDHHRRDGGGRCHFGFTPCTLGVTGRILQSYPCGQPRPGRVAGSIQLLESNYSILDKLHRAYGFPPASVQYPCSHC
jgi:hypothetical protein